MTADLANEPRCEGCGVLLVQIDGACAGEHHRTVVRLTDLARRGLVPLPMRLAQTLAAARQDVWFVELGAFGRFGYACAVATLEGFEAERGPTRDWLLRVAATCRAGAPWWYAVEQHGQVPPAIPFGWLGLRTGPVETAPAPDAPPPAPTDYISQRSQLPPPGAVRPQARFYCLGTRELLAAQVGPDGEARWVVCPANEPGWPRSRGGGAL